MNQERLIHSSLSSELIAPIRSDSPKQLKEAELLFFDTSLHRQAAEFGQSLNRLVSLEMMPASMVVIEKFAKNYANHQTAGTRRRKRLEHQYRIGGMIGLAAVALQNSENTWEECHPHTVTSLSTVIDYEKMPADAVRVDPISSAMIDELAEHTTADIHDPEDLIHATKLGYFIARELATLSIEKL